MKLSKITIIWLAYLLSVSTHAATLVWDANPPEEQVTAYIVHYHDGTTLTSVDVGNVTSWNIDALPKGFTYTFYLTAINASGIESDPSSTVGWTPGLPSPPMPVFISTRGKREGKNFILSLAWQDYEAKWEVTGYGIQVIQGTVTNAPIFQVERSIQLTVPDFSPTFVKVWAINYVGAGSPATASFSKPGNRQNPRKEVP